MDETYRLVVGLVLRISVGGLLFRGLLLCGLLFCGLLFCGWIVVLWIVVVCSTEEADDHEPRGASFGFIVHHRFCCHTHEL